MVLDSLLILGDPIDGDDPLGWGQELGGGGKVGEDEEGDDAPEDGEGAENEEDVHPACKSSGYMADGVTDQAAEHRGEAIGTVVDFKTKGLFRGSVPHGHEEDETGVDSCFYGTEEEPWFGH